MKYDNDTAHSWHMTWYTHNVNTYVRTRIIQIINSDATLSGERGNHSQTLCYDCDNIISVHDITSEEDCKYF